MIESIGFNKVINLQIVSLLMSETGTYNIQQNRPYQTDMPGNIVDVLTNRVMDSPNHRINGSILSGITGSFLQPQATPESEIRIVNGWNEKRIRFILKIKCDMQGGAVRMYYVQGYTDFTGVSSQGNVAPDMNFYVNSIIQTRLTTMHTPMGPQVFENTFENSHLLMDDKFSDMRGASNMRLMRPEDVFNSLQISHIPDTYGGGLTLDSRSMLHREAVMSRRSNGLGANYAASIIDGYSSATDGLAMGSSQMELYTQSRRNVIENPAALDPFLHALTLVTSKAVNNKFTYENLRTLDNNVDNVTNYQVTGPTQLAMMHQTGMTAHWNGTDRITQAATIISQSIPSLMIELMLTKVYLESNNHGIGGRMDTRLITAESLTAGDQTNNYAVFKNRFEQSLLADLTFGNSVSYAIKLEVNLIGDTRLSISLDGSAFYDYVTPSFCDSLMVPVVTTNPDTISNLVHDFEQLTNSIHEAVGQSMGHSVINNDAFSQINSNF